jgi:hypothetical protein
MSGGRQIDQTIDVNVVPGNFETLREALAMLGIAGPDIDDLKRALAEDAPAEDAPAEAPGSLGPATATWLERYRAEAGETAITLANGVPAGLITELIVRFLS